MIWYHNCHWWNGSYSIMKMLLNCVSNIWHLFISLIQLRCPNCCTSHTFLEVFASKVLFCVKEMTFRNSEQTITKTQSATIWFFDFLRKIGEFLNISKTPDHISRKQLKRLFWDQLFVYRIFSVCQDVPLHDSGGSSAGDDGDKCSENKEKVRQHDSSAIVTAFTSHFIWRLKSGLFEGTGGCWWWGLMVRHFPTSPNDPAPPNLSEDILEISRVGIWISTL